MKVPHTDTLNINKAIMVHLPPLPLCIDNMSQADLRTLIPQIIRQSCQRVNTYYGKQSMKPRWWPVNLQWDNPRNIEIKNAKDQNLARTEMMRRIVSCCYKYHKKDAMLKGPLVDRPSSLNIENAATMAGGTQVSATANGNDMCSTTTEAVIVLPPPDPTRAPHPHLTARNTTTSSHKPSNSSRSSNNSNAKPALGANDNTASSMSTAGPDSLSTDQPRKCSYCDIDVPSQQLLYSHYDTCKERHRIRAQYKSNVVATASVSSSSSSALSSVMQRGPWLHRNTHARLPTQRTIYRRPDKSVYMAALELTTTENAQVLRSPQKQISTDCDIIDLCDDDVVSPKTPKSAKKTFLTQTSRDGSQTPCGSRQAAPAIGTLVDMHSDSSSDSDDSTTYEGSPRNTKSVLTIDIASLLGQRIKDHVQSTVATQPCSFIRDSNQFCKTPVKNDMITKLRHREDSSFPYAFRPTRRMATRYTHIYHQRRKAQREYARCLETGLNKRSRVLKKWYSGLRVRLEQLSPQAFDYYYHPTNSSSCVPSRFRHRPGPKTAKSYYQSALQWHYLQLAQRRLRNFEPSVKPGLLQEYKMLRALVDKHAQHQVPEVDVAAKPPPSLAPKPPHTAMLGGVRPRMGFRLHRPELERILMSRQPPVLQRPILPGLACGGHMRQHNHNMTSNFNSRQMAVAQATLTPPSTPTEESPPPVIVHTGRSPPTSVIQQSSASANRLSLARLSPLVRGAGTQRQPPPLVRAPTTQICSTSSAKQASTHTNNHAQAKPSKKAAVICISSDEEDDDNRKNYQVSHPLKPATAPPPTHKLTLPTVMGQQSATAVFKCHLCAMELICDATELDFINRHFKREHGVDCCVVTKKDANNKDVITIVQKGTHTSSQPAKLGNSSVNRTQSGTRPVGQSSIRRPAILSPAKRPPSVQTNITMMPKIPLQSQNSVSGALMVRKLEYNKANATNATCVVPMAASSDVICLD